MKYFIYCRKSTESEDRQVLSIDSQHDELRRMFGDKSDIEIIEVYRESFSAKAPGRALFSEMLKRIEHGDADGIIAWHPDRLARNSIDGGRIIYLLDEKKLKDLKFATSSFENNPQGKFMLSIIFGYSKYYVDSLSENIKRGNRAKLQRGWWPNRAPIGYLNDKNARTIIPDPARLPLVRKLFDLALTGNYSLRRIWDEARRWDLRSQPRKRSGGQYLAIASIHRILRNPFYAGQIVWNGENHQGAHEPIVSFEEFDRVQRHLGRCGKQAPQKRVFPFTGLIRCGECGFMVTAEEKVNRYGRHYTYYHCSKRRLDHKCQQRSVQAVTLDAVFENALSTLSISSKVHDWVRQEIQTARQQQGDDHQEHKSKLKRALESTDKALSNVTTLRIRDSINDDEFTRQRHSLHEEQLRLQEQLRLVEEKRDQWFEPAETLIWFSNRAISWFREGDASAKRRIIRAIGSNLTLVDKKVSIEARKPFAWFPENADRSDLWRVVEVVRTLHTTRDPEFLDTVAQVTAIVKEHEADQHREKKKVA